MQKIMDICRKIQRGSQPGRADLSCSLLTDADVPCSTDRGAQKAETEEPETVGTGEQILSPYALR